MMLSHLIDTVNQLWIDPNQLINPLIDHSSTDIINGYVRANQSIPLLKQFLILNKLVFFLTLDGRVGYCSITEECQVTYLNLPVIKKLVSSYGDIRTLDVSGYLHQVYNLSHSRMLKAGIKNIYQINDHNYIQIDRNNMLLQGCDRTPLDPIVKHNRDIMITEKHDVIMIEIKSIARWEPITIINDHHIIDVAKYDVNQVLLLYQYGTLTMINTQSNVQNMLTIDITPTRFIRIVDMIDVIEDVNGDLYTYTITNNRLTTTKLLLPDRLIEQS